MSDQQPYHGPERRRDAQELYTRLDQQIAETGALIEGVEKLAAAIAARPTARQVAFRRRMVALMLTLGIIFAIQFDDIHIEQCMFPYQVARQMDTEYRAPATCGISFPTHTHRTDMNWPTPYNLIGIALYAILIGSMMYWVWLARPRKDPPEIIEPKVNRRIDLPD